MKQQVVITNGQVVLPDRIIKQGQIIIDKGRIDKISCRQMSPGLGLHIIDAGGGYIMPGFIDIHSDAIEKEIEPRPGTFFQPELAFLELEKKLVGQGITTMFHSFSFAGAEWGIREDSTAAEIIRQIANISSERAIIRNKIHTRFEITDYSGREIIQELLADGMTDLLSFMDHTPGQGQYPTLEDYQRYLAKTYHLSYDQVEKVLEEKEKGRSCCQETVEILRLTAFNHQVPLASHDDDSPEKVLAYKEMGVTINEFPVNLESAHQARLLANDVCVGAPNIVRGKSSGKAMRALDAIISGSANIICSDYYPPSILHAVFKLATEHMPLYEAVNMASLFPARATGLLDLGSLEEGNWGDIVIVNTKHGLPVVTHAVVNGVPVYEINYRMPKIKMTEQYLMGGIANQ
jgi:alpha-D-ribose 1-methylphosphonate 5-triphosphate diphosphatase